jgi:hypothetical protein
MAFTQTDQESVQAAVIALATGSRVVSATMGDKTIQYGQADVDKLRALLSEIKTELSAAAGRRRYLLTSSSKGL